MKKIMLLLAGLALMVDAQAVSFAE